MSQNYNKNASNTGRHQKKDNKNFLENLLHRRVQIIAADGRIFVGSLKGLDQTMNCILADAKEHIYSSSSEEGIKEVELGMYLIRGELIAAIGKFFNNRDLLDR